MTWRSLIIALGMLIWLAGCAAPTPPVPPALPVPPVSSSLHLDRAFPSGADHDHLALSQLLGNEGRPGEESRTFYQFADHPFNIGPGWCTTLPEKTAQNWQHMRWELTVDGMPVPLADYPVTDGERVTGVCRFILVVATAIPPGDHELDYTLTLDETIGDGTYRYPPGRYVNHIHLVGIPRLATPVPRPRPRPLPTLIPGSQPG
jgi:hypothetical protein